MRHLESKLQKACVKWLRLQYPYIRTIPANADFKFHGTSEQCAVAGRRMVDMGYCKGTADIQILISNRLFHSLFIEFKILKGKQTKEQLKFEQYCWANDFAYHVVRSFDEFREVVTNYLR